MVQGTKIIVHHKKLRVYNLCAPIFILMLNVRNHYGYGYETFQFNNIKIKTLRDDWFTIATSLSSSSQLLPIKRAKHHQNCFVRVPENM